MKPPTRSNETLRQVIEDTGISDAIVNMQQELIHIRRESMDIRSQPFGGDSISELSHRALTMRNDPRRSLSEPILEGSHKGQDVIAKDYTTSSSEIAITAGGGGLSDRFAIGGSGWETLARVSEAQEQEGLDNEEDESR